MSGHGKVAAVGIFVCTAPGMVHTHWIVRGNRAVEKGPFLLAVILFPEQLKGSYPPPKIEDRSFEARKVDFRGNLVEVRLHAGKTYAWLELISILRKRNYRSEERRVGKALCLGRMS